MKRPVTQGQVEQLTRLRKLRVVEWISVKGKTRINCVTAQGQPITLTMIKEA